MRLIEQIMAFSRTRLCSFFVNKQLTHLTTLDQVMPKMVSAILVTILDFQGGVRGLRCMD